MILPVLQYPDSRLASVCGAVTKFEQALRDLVDNMVETMYARDGIGLAAPQIGMPVRLVVMDISGPDRRKDLRVLVNPQLTLSGRVVESEEGCLSVPEYRSCIDRREFVHVEGLDIDGTPLVFDAEGLLAICVQHECDHLEGILFIDHVSRLKRTMLDRKMRKKGR